MGMHPKQRSQISVKSIVITPHAQLRMKERSKCTHKQEIVNMVFTARYQGLNINALNKAYIRSKGLDISDELYQYLKGAFYSNTSTEIIQLYKNFIFVFCGKKGRTLKTVMTIPDKFR